jgi:hypothetical protein
MSQPYFYCISRGESVPGTLFFLLSAQEADLIEIFKVCGFYIFRRGIFLFQRLAFKTCVGATLERGTVKFYSFRKEVIIKIGLGEHPCWLLDQLKEKFDPLRFQMLTADAESKSSKDSLMRLFDKLPTEMPTTITETPTTTETTGKPLLLPQ